MFWTNWGRKKVLRDCLRLLQNTIPVDIKAFKDTSQDPNDWIVELLGRHFSIVVLVQFGDGEPEVGNGCNDVTWPLIIRGVNVRAKHRPDILCHQRTDNLEYLVRLTELIKSLLWPCMGRSKLLQGAEVARHALRIRQMASLPEDPLVPSDPWDLPLSLFLSWWQNKKSIFTKQDKCLTLGQCSKWGRSQGQGLFPRQEAATRVLSAARVAPWAAPWFACVRLSWVPNVSKVRYKKVACPSSSWKCQFHPCVAQQVDQRGWSGERQNWTHTRNLPRDDL